jgi:molybdopterin synthase catalytic subunit
MAISIYRVSIYDTPLRLPEREWNEDAGAVVDFCGVVRHFEGEREIQGIDYEAHLAMAQHQLEMIAQQAVADYTLIEVIIDHRVGFVAVAEPSLFLRVASSRRKAAFAASEWIIDELKRKVPIWKRPVFRDSGGAGRTSDSERAAKEPEVAQV